IRHLGEALRGGHDWPERIMDAPSPSILGCIAKKLPIVAISRDFLAFEDDFSDESGSSTRCWVTLLPLSAGGAWVDYVYALVSLETVPAKGAKTAEKPVKAEPPADEAGEDEQPVAEVEELDEPAEEIVEPVEAVADEPEEADPEAPTSKPQKAAAKAAPGFSKLFDSLAGLTGFHAQSVKVEPVLPEIAEEEPATEDTIDPEP